MTDIKTLIERANGWLDSAHEDHLMSTEHSLVRQLLAALILQGNISFIYEEALERIEEMSTFLGGEDQCQIATEALVETKSYKPSEAQ